MKIYRVDTNADRSQFNERDRHLVHAKNATEAIRKAIRLARKSGSYKSYDAVSLELVGDAE
jgi:hypothetical protein